MSDDHRQILKGITKGHFRHVNGKAIWVPDYNTARPEGRKATLAERTALGKHKSGEHYLRATDSEDAAHIQNAAKELGIELTKRRAGANHHGRVGAYDHFHVQDPAHAIAIHDKLKQIQEPEEDESPVASEKPESPLALKDEQNPKYALQTHDTKHLREAAAGKRDLNQHAKAELAARGLDSHGKWIGFAAAGKHHGVESMGGYDEGHGHFQTMHNDILGAAARGELDLNQAAKEELAARGEKVSGTDAAKVAGKPQAKGSPTPSENFDELNTHAQSIKELLRAPGVTPGLTASARSREALTASQRAAESREKDDHDVAKQFHRIAARDHASTKSRTGDAATIRNGMDLAEVHEKLAKWHEERGNVYANAETFKTPEGTDAFYEKKYGTKNPPERAETDKIVAGTHKVEGGKTVPKDVAESHERLGAMLEAQDRKHDTAFNLVGGIDWGRKNDYADNLAQSPTRLNERQQQAVRDLQQQGRVFNMNPDVMSAMPKEWDDAGRPQFFLAKDAKGNHYLVDTQGYSSARYVAKIELPPAQGTGQTPMGGSRTVPAAAEAPDTAAANQEVGLQRVDAMKDKVGGDKAALEALERRKQRAAESMRIPKTLEEATARMEAENKSAYPEGRPDSMLTSERKRYEEAQKAKAGKGRPAVAEQEYNEGHVEQDAMEATQHARNAGEGHHPLSARAEDATYKAHETGSAEDHAAAAQAHKKAADYHQNAATYRNADHESHYKAQDAHKGLATMHDTMAKRLQQQGAKPEGTKEKLPTFHEAAKKYEGQGHTLGVWTDGGEVDGQKAHTLEVRDKTGKVVGSHSIAAHPDNIKHAEAANAPAPAQEKKPEHINTVAGTKAGWESTKAHTLSANANRTGAAQHHVKASDSHYAAAEAHKKAAKEVRSTTGPAKEAIEATAKMHEDKAAEHTKLGMQHREQIYNPTKEGTAPKYDPNGPAPHEQGMTSQEPEDKRRMVVQARKDEATKKHPAVDHLAIAKKHVPGLTTLESQSSDRSDFHDMSKASMRSMIEDAYGQGSKGKKPTAGDIHKIYNEAMGGEGLYDVTEDAGRDSEDFKEHSVRDLKKIIQRAHNMGAGHAMGDKAAQSVQKRNDSIREIVNAPKPSGIAPQAGKGPTPKPEAAPSNLHPDLAEHKRQSGVLQRDHGVKNPYADTAWDTSAAGDHKHAQEEHEIAGGWFKEEAKKAKAAGNTNKALDLYEHGDIHDTVAKWHGKQMEAPKPAPEAAKTAPKPATPKAEPRYRNGMTEAEMNAKLAKVKKQPPDLTAGEFNRREC